MAGPKAHISRIFKAILYEIISQIPAIFLAGAKLKGLKSHCGGHVAGSVPAPCKINTRNDLGKNPLS